MTKMIDHLLIFLTTKTHPHFGRIALISLLAYGGYSLRALNAWISLEGKQTIRYQMVSFLSLLPDSLLFDDRLFHFTRWAFCFFAVLWALQRVIPWSAWATVFFFTANISLCLERIGSAFHTVNLLNAGLIIFAIWYSFYSKEIKLSLTNKTFYQEKLYPNWVSFLCIFCISYYYFLSGINKLRISGLEWVNGISLQIWTLAFADQNSLLAEILLKHQGLAWLLQCSSLALEVGALACVFYPKTRLWIGLGLVSFHVTQIHLFGWDFGGNLIMIILFYLPLQCMVTKTAESGFLKVHAWR